MGNWVGRIEEIRTWEYQREFSNVLQISHNLKKKRKTKETKENNNNKKSSYEDIVLKYSKAYYKKEIQLYRELRSSEGKKRQLI